MGSRHFGLFKESTYGTSGTPTKFFEVQNSSLRTVHANHEAKLVRTVSTRIVSLLTEHVEGDVEIFPSYEDMHLLCHAFYGQAPTTTGTGPYTHTFPPTAGLGTRIGHSFSSELRRNDALCSTFKGMKMTGLALRAAVTEPMFANTSWIGKTEVNGVTPASATYATLAPAIPSQISVSFDGGAQSAYEMNLNLGWEVDQPFKLGATTFAVEPDDADTLNVALQVGMYFTSETEYDKYLAGTDVDVSIVASAGASQSVTININKAKITDISQPVEGRDRLRATFSLLGYFDTTATDACQIVVVNSVTNAAF